MLLACNEGAMLGRAAAEGLKADSAFDLAAALLRLSAIGALEFKR